MPLQGLVRDMFGNIFVRNTTDVDDSSSDWDDEQVATAVGSFTPDTQGPKLLAFDLDKDHSLLRLYFDEPVNTSSLHPTSITLVAWTHKLALPTYTLTSGSKYSSNASSSDHTMVAIALSASDLILLNRLRPDLATRQANTYIEIKRGLVRDRSPSSNRNQAIPDGSALQLGPVLRYFYLDMNLGVITLVFSKAVDVTTFEPTGISLLNDGGYSAYTLTGEGHTQWVNSTYDNTTVVLHLTQFDLNAIKEFGDLCLAEASSYVTLTEVVKDYRKVSACCGPNYNVEVSSFSPKKAVWYTADTTPPTLEKWELDLSGGYVHLYFDEPVQASSLQVTGVTVSHPGTSASLTLTAKNTVVTSNGTLQSIKLQTGGGLGQELDKIKLMLAGTSTALASDVALALEAGTVTDMALAQNPNLGNVSDPLPASSLTLDRSAPELLYYDLNMSSNLLTMVFDEVVNATTFDVTALYFYPSSSNTFGDYRGFGNTSYVTNAASETVVNISISQEDMDYFRLYAPLLSGPDYVYLFAAGGA